MTWRKTAADTPSTVASIIRTAAELETASSRIAGPLGRTLLKGTRAARGSLSDPCDAPRMRFGTPLSPTAARLLLLGSGELGKEVAIEAMRLGCEVIACDRYANAPAMQVAHRSHVFS